MLAQERERGQAQEQEQIPGPVRAVVEEADQEEEGIFAEPARRAGQAGSEQVWRRSGRSL